MAFTEVQEAMLLASAAKFDKLAPGLEKVVAMAPVLEEVIQHRAIAKSVWETYVSPQIQKHAPSWMGGLLIAVTTAASTWYAKPAIVAPLPPVVPSVQPQEEKKTETKDPLPPTGEKK